MHKKVFKKMRDDIKEHYVLYIVYALFLFIALFRLNYYIYSPGELIDLSDRIIVENSYEQKGSFNLTYVTSRNATILTYLLSYVIPNWDLESIDEVRVENESETDILNRGKIYLKETSYDAIIAAFTEAGLPYKVNRTDIVVTHVFDFADTNIVVGDIVKKVNGNEINSVLEVNDYLASLNENDELVVEVERNNKIVKCSAKVKIMEERKLIGISLALLKDVETNPKVEYIFSDSESGSSRGLMCALDIYNKITEYDLTKGDTISGTGTIDENGNVLSIDGVKYKLIGAVSEGAKVFIVPTDNYEEALKLKEENNYDIELIEADTLHNVIERLKER